MEPEPTGPIQKPTSSSELRKAASRGPAHEAGRRRTVGYSDKPDFADPQQQDSGQKGKSRKLMAAGAIAAAVLVGLGIFAVTPAAPSWLRLRPAAVEEHRNLLVFTNDDMDHAATDKARAALQRGEVPPELANLSEAERQEILRGERALFTLRLMDEFNSLVYFHVDGAAVMAYQVGEGRRLLTIALKKGEPAQLRLTAARDGGSGVHLVAATSAGELRTRTMAVGESEDWTLLVR